MALKSIFSRLTRPYCCPRPIWYHGWPFDMAWAFSFYENTQAKIKISRPEWNYPGQVKIILSLSHCNLGLISSTWMNVNFREAFQNVWLRWPRCNHPLPYARKISIQQDNMLECWPVWPVQPVCPTCSWPVLKNATQTGQILNFNLNKIVLIFWFPNDFY